MGWKSQEGEIAGEREEEELKASIDVFKADLVVMTQACDLRERKVSNVVLCPHSSLNEYKQVWQRTMETRGQNPTPKSWESHRKSICDGFIFNLSILNAGEDCGLTTEHRVVDFSEVYSLPRTFLEFLLKSRSARLRLMPPYREHLSQAFARFYMRVGLPADIQFPTA